jgi:predicted secreted protein
MNSKIDLLSKKLKDERSKKVIFLSHCILNENTRYLGGAFRQGSINEVLEEIQKRGIGIVQMKCPEQIAWGGVLKSSMWIPLYRKNRLIKKILVPIFILHTKRIYKKIAKEVLKDIKDYKNSDFEVLGIVGVSASPTCGVNTSIEITKFINFLEGSSIKDINRKQLNEQYIKGSIVTRSGIFIDVLKNLLEKSDLHIKLYEHDLIKEMNKEKISFDV